MEAAEQHIATASQPATTDTSLAFTPERFL